MGKKNPPKEAGNSGRCFKCDGTMFCRETTYQGETKLVWRNKDGSSHYDKNGDCRGGNPNEYSTTEAPVKQMDVSEFKPKYITPQAQVLFTDLFRKAVEFHLLGHKIIQEEFKDITNPAAIGSIQKITQDFMARYEEPAND